MCRSKLAHSPIDASKQCRRHFEAGCLCSLPGEELEQPLCSYIVGSFFDRLFCFVGLLRFLGVLSSMPIDRPLINSTFFSQ
jgi:hypothetical protein